MRPRRKRPWPVSKAPCSYPCGILGTLLLLGLALFVIPASAQTYEYTSGITAAFTFNPLLTTQVGSGTLVMQGGGAQIAAQSTRGWGVVGDFSGFTASWMAKSTAGLDLLTIAGGPRYNWQMPYRPYGFYVQALVGEAVGFNSMFPGKNASAASASAMLVEGGGGFDVVYADRLSVRAVEIDWVRTSLPNSGSDDQNSLRIGAGIRVRLR